LKRAAAVPARQIHRLARCRRVNHGEPAAGPLLQGGLLAGSDSVPELGDHRAPVGTPGVQDGVGPPDRIRTCGFSHSSAPVRPRGVLAPASTISASMPARATPVVTAVMRPDPTLDWQLIGDARPARPLVLEGNAELRHRPPLRQEHVLGRPVEAAGAAQSCDVPAPRDDLGLGARPAPAARSGLVSGHYPLFDPHRAFGALSESSAMCQGTKSLRDSRLMRWSSAYPRGR